MLAGGGKARQALLLSVNPTARAARELKLSKSQCSIGSQESNDLVVPDGSVSARHALIRRHRTSWQVIDNGSTNGTYVDDRKAVDWIELRDGTEVRFGAARFIFRVGGASAARATRNFRVRPRASGLRALIVLISVGLVGGFAATQYYLYRWYEARALNAHSASSEQPSPKSMTVAEATNHAASTRGSTPWLERVNH